MSDTDEWEKTKEAAQYYYEVSTAIDEYGKDFVMNMDETAILCNNAPNTSWGDKGTGKNNSIYTNKGEKCSYSLLPTITVSGEMIKFAWINKAKTSAAINRMSLPNEIKSYYSKSGWMNEGIMMDFIEDVIFQYTQAMPCALIVDSYGAHFTDEVKRLAAEYNIQLIMVPKGQTGTLQPLDISFNYYMKQHNQKVYLEELLNSIGNVDDRQNVIVRAFNSCYSVDKNIILNGWKSILI
jgi:hypothetical protein